MNGPETPPSGGPSPGDPGSDPGPADATGASVSTARWGWWVAIGLVAIVVAVVIAVILLREDEDDTIAGGTTSTTAAPTSTTSTTSPAPDGAVFVWRPPAAIAADPVATAAAFMADYVGMDDPQPGEFREGGPGEGEVEVLPPGGAPLPTTVVLRDAGDGDWGVVTAVSGNIEVDSPAVLDVVASPAPVSGRANAFEGTVLVEVRQDGMGFGQALGRGFVTGSGDPGGALGPFEGEITFDPPSQAAGAVVFYTESAEDGSVQQATVVRVQFGA